jgi:2-oxoglutarate ferredoxin oxidoreductase subunit beta
MGVFRDVQHATYDTLMSTQLERAAEQASGDDAALQALLRGADTWQVSPT